MKTLYIDIYFLINFVVDIISLHFAALLTRIKVSNKRLLFAALLGALCACIWIFVDVWIINALLFLLTLMFAVIFCANNSSVKGKMFFAGSLVIFLSLIGSIVSFVWNFLERALSDYLIENNSINRKMLFFALIALLSIGVFKMLVTVMNTGKVETKIEIEICFLGKTCCTEALVDTGNLAMDPLGMKPVLIIKKELANKFVPDKIISLSDIDELENGIRKRIRLVPLTKNGSTHVYTGFVPDRIKARHNKKSFPVDVTVVIDKEGGDFGGYWALMPYSAVSNVIN